MSYEDYLRTNGLIMSDEEAREYIRVLFEYYNLKKEKGTLYKQHDKTPLNIISLYTNYIKKRELHIIYGDYKSRFILNESRVEPGVTEEEKQGLGKIYDYIRDFPKEKEINIFIESFMIHNLLYSCCPFPEYGSTLRKEDVCLYDTPYDVVPGSDVMIEFNKYIQKKINLTENTNVFDYIMECIKLTVDLIKLQPFNDGNKRTFRALLNLLLTKVGIPPIYIKQEERDVYKKELLKAICKNDYEDLFQFYFYKIADSIVSLDIYSEDKSIIYIDPKKKIKKIES